MTKDLTLRLEDRAGTLAAAAAALGSAGINVLGACGFPADGDGMVHVCVEDEYLARAREALIRTGTTIDAERDVLVVGVAHRAGGLAAALRPLAQAGLKVNLLYLTERGELVLGLDDIERGRTALGLV